MGTGLGAHVNVRYLAGSRKYATDVMTGLPLLPLRDGFGQRYFIVGDPAGNLVDVIEDIPPAEEYASADADA
jgi:hypothetical protein